MTTHLEEISERLKAAMQWRPCQDEDLIAHAPSDIAFLLDALREAEAKLSECRCWKDEHCPLHSVGIAKIAAELMVANSALRDATERLGRAEKVVEAARKVHKAHCCETSDKCDGIEDFGWELSPAIAAYDAAPTGGRASVPARIDKLCYCDSRGHEFKTHPREACIVDGCCVNSPAPTGER